MRMTLIDDVFIVQRPEHVRITDFGLAKLLSNRQGTMFSTTGEKVTDAYHHSWLSLIGQCCQVMQTHRWAAITVEDR